MVKKYLPLVLGYFIIPLISIWISNKISMYISIALHANDTEYSIASIMLAIISAFLYLIIAFILEIISTKKNLKLTLKYLIMSPVTWVHFFMRLLPFY